jgi:predicted metal-dependent peptidase
MAQLMAEQRIERIHVQLMKHPNFCLFAGLFMIGKVEVRDKTASGTAQTNGVDVVYDRGFVDSLNDKQLAFLILHENMHKAYRHLVVWQPLRKKNAQLANMACDYVINLQIRDYDPQNEITDFPTDAEGNVLGLIDERFRGMDSGQVFKILEEEQQGGGGGGGGEGKEPLDGHEWDEAQDMSDSDKEEVAKEIEQALRQGSMLVGKMGGNVSREIGDMLVPKVDWREALRDFIKTAMQGKDKSTWKRLHKRYLASDLIMPSSYSEKVGGIAIGIDTSGSIGGEELNQFLSEVKSICDEVSPEKIDLMYWDTHVASIETYRDNELAGLVETTKPAGGGGTEPACVPKYMKKHDMKPECLIILTDGYIPNQDPSDWSIESPVLWCIKGNSHFNQSVVGKVVHVE